MTTVLAMRLTGAYISGRVTDQNNAVVPDADINIEKVDAHIDNSAKTNAEGLYVFPWLQPGDYELAVSKSGFRSTTVRELKLDVQGSVSQNVMLQIGSRIESVTVDAGTAFINNFIPCSRLDAKYWRLGHVEGCER